MATVETQTQTHAGDASLFYKQVPETSYELEWAQLATLDLSKFDQPGGKEVLAKQLEQAIQTIGFFYIVNFGLSQEEVDRQFAIGKSVFELPSEEKLKYRADLENGGYNGYKPLGLRQVAPGVVDNTEIYNIPKFIPAYAQPHPEIITAHKDEIEHFARHIHDNIVRKLLVLFSIILELPEDALTSHHRYTEKSDCHLRYMKYHRRSAEDNKRLENVWVKGHTDFGSLTLLFRQPVAALQVRGAEDEAWRWVKPFDGSITVNVADALQFLTNGFLKSSIHRVVAPPPDQAHVDRLGVLYFVRPEDGLELRPVQSAVLARLGYDKNADEAAVGITAGEWVKARVKGNISRISGTDKEQGTEQEVLKGKKAKYYN
ncbi:hypothetical protein SBRCBS47491_009686 [Sporothrix bragantina]|uniref:Flavonol synthase n=1 Tax=Sporothrix bragantina TaxID=671064 RepID=A0ABP0CWS9_9PEZI